MPSRSLRKRTGENLTGFDAYANFMFAIAGVDVWWCMVVLIHRDHYPEKAADLWHDSSRGRDSSRCILRPEHGIDRLKSRRPDGNQIEASGDRRHRAPAAIRMSIRWSALRPARPVIRRSIASSVARSRSFGVMTARAANHSHWRPGCRRRP